jgi:hypothetical protein
MSKPTDRRVLLQRNGASRIPIGEYRRQTHPGNQPEIAAEFDTTLVSSSLPVARGSFVCTNRDGSKSVGLIPKLRVSLPGIFGNAIATGPGLQSSSGDRSAKASKHTPNETEPGVAVNGSRNSSRFPSVRYGHFSGTGARIKGVLFP